MVAIILCVSHCVLIYMDTSTACGTLVTSLPSQWRQLEVIKYQIKEKNVLRELWDELTDGLLILFMIVVVTEMLIDIVY